MNRNIAFKEIMGGYVLAGLTLCFGFFLTLKVGVFRFGNVELGSLFLKTSYFLALAIVLNFTCALGRLRGFPLRREDGSIIGAHLFRCLVMTGIVWAAICFLMAPVVLFIFRHAR